MNLHFPQLPAAGIRLARCVSLTLLPMLTSESMALTQPIRAGSARSISAQSALLRPTYFSTPYLALLLPPTLQFQKAPPPIDPALRLVAGAPTRPGGTEEEIVAANRDSIVPRTTEEEPASAEATLTATKAVPVETSPLPKSSLPPVSILPDDTPRDIRAEDVLPFFQFPGGAPTAPTPGTIPPSSATYRQR